MVPRAESERNMLRKILPPVAVAAGAFFLLSNDPVAADDIDGTAGDDVLNGTDNGDDIDGAAGNDTINAAGGDDYVEGGQGNDTVNGGEGDDGLHGSEGDDTINGEGGEDYVTGDAGNDTIDGGTGDDELIGDDDNTCEFTQDVTCGGADTINGGDGDDEIVGDGNFCVSDQPRATVDSATAAATAAATNADCAGDDTLNGGAGDDEISGDDNYCYLGTFEENEVDVAVAAATAAATNGACAGDDTIDGGDGDDWLLGDDNYCYVTAENGLDGDDACAGDDTISGGAGNDDIIGDYVECEFGNNGYGLESDNFASLAGCAGDDILNGGAGDDDIVGDSSRSLLDALFLGNGLVCTGSDVRDLMSEFFGALLGRQGVPVDPSMFERCVPGGNDTIDGGDGDDQIRAGMGDDIATGGNGNDLVVGDLAFVTFPVFGDFEEEDIEDLDDFIDFLLGLSDEDLTYFLFEGLYIYDAAAGGGNDDITGGAGIDVLIGAGGHDIVCGDADDALVSGGAGSDIPCPVKEGTFDASHGPVTLDLSEGIRELDDEFMEVDENGAANPWELVIVVAPTKGTLTIVGTMVTYTPNAGATGSDFYEYAIRRKIVECPGDITVTFVEEQETVFDLCLDGTEDPEVAAAFARAIVVVGEDSYIQSGSKRITLTLAVPVVPPVVPPAVQAQTATQALPVTGGDLGLALAGLGLVALGAVVTAESKRRRNLLEVRA